MPRRPKPPTTAEPPAVKSLPLRAATVHNLAALWFSVARNDHPDAFDPRWRDQMKTAYATFREALPDPTRTAADTPLEITLSLDTWGAMLNFLAAPGQLRNARAAATAAKIIDAITATDGQQTKAI